MKFPSTKPFLFKQFSVDDSQSAMKVGTDAVLLGCFSKGNKRGKLLDIGSGSGLIALMLAQKNPAAEIWAVEIDELAHLQSLRNFEASAWSQRIHPVHARIQDFADNTPLFFDMIVCNPPFFKTDKKLHADSRKTARQEEQLNYKDIAFAVKKLLAPKGAFCCILPTDRMHEMHTYLKDYFIYPNKMLHLRGKSKLERKRSIIAYSDKKIDQPVEDELIVRQQSNEYTDAYRNFTKDFYLNF